MTGFSLKRFNNEIRHVWVNVKKCHSCDKCHKSKQAAICYNFSMSLNLYMSLIVFQVALAIGYRLYEGVMGFLNIPTKMCWEVNRGEGLSPVQSCEGKFALYL